PLGRCADRALVRDRHRGLQFGEQHSVHRAFAAPRVPDPQRRPVMANLRRLEWQLEIMPPLRAGQETEVGLLLRNGKKFLPTYALWFEFAARPFERGAA